MMASSDGKWVVANWKMTGMGVALDRWCDDVREGLEGVIPFAKDNKNIAVSLGFIPPFPYLARAVIRLEGVAGISVGAQNCCYAVSGAFTGEVSARMIKDVGATYSLIGHSERRHVFGESDAITKEKAQRAWEEGLGILFCIGETLEERESGQVEAVLLRQLRDGLPDFTSANIKPDTLYNQLVIAYEPVWAIGTGRAALPEDAARVHTFVRETLAKMLPGGEHVKILYGGSVKPENVAAFLGRDEVDGALVGGASQTADSFLAIARGAMG